MSYSRADRVGEQIQREISRMIQDGLKDPRIGMVTISRVQITPDLRYARVFYTVYGDDEARKSTHEGLTRSAGYIRRQLGSMLRMRFIPEIVFLFDGSLEHAHRINTLLKEVERMDAARAAEAAGVSMGELADAAASTDDSDDDLEDEEDDDIDEEDDSEEDSIEDDIDDQDDEDFDDDDEDDDDDLDDEDEDEGA